MPQRAAVQLSKGRLVVGSARTVETEMQMRERGDFSTIQVEAPDHALGELTEAAAR
jgi:hypothetical protein